MLKTLDKSKQESKRRKTVYSRLKLDISNAISHGSLTPGSLMPSENELAEDYKISRSSVRTALNELESEGLIFKKPGKGTFVKDHTMMIMETSEDTINTIGFDFCIDPKNSENWYSSKLLRGIEQICNSNGCRLALMRNFDISQVRKGFIDGFICTTAGDDIQNLEKMSLLGIHPVLINRLSYHEKISYFSVNYRKESEKAVRDLCRRGHDDIGIISGAIAEMQTTNLPRYSGYCDAMGNEVNMDFSRHCITPRNMSDDYYAEMIRDYLLKSKATALFLLNGCFAVPLKQAADSLGIRIGHDIEVACFDDIGYLIPLLGFPISYVKMPLQQIGSDAASFLIQKFSNEKIPAVKKIYEAEIINIK